MIETDSSIRKKQREKLISSRINSGHHLFIFFSHKNISGFRNLEMCGMTEKSTHSSLHFLL